MDLKYTLSGLIYISPEDDCKATVDAMLATSYEGDFCIAEGFDPDFISRLMEAGFLVMSINISKQENEPDYIMLPKLHLVRSALYFENLHVKRSIKRFLDRYELKADAEFEKIIDRCVEKHGNDWLTPPLVESIKKIRQNFISNNSDSTGLDSSLLHFNSALPYPSSFALYRDGELVAGEFGVICGRIYTSYSGYYDEANAGTVQLIHTAHYLKENGFSFFDLGMPLDYKTDLGAVDISPEEFVRLWRGEE